MQFHLRIVSIFLKTCLKDHGDSYGQFWVGKKFGGTAAPLTPLAYTPMEQHIDILVECWLICWPRVVVWLSAKMLMDRLPTFCQNFLFLGMVMYDNDMIMSLKLKKKEFKPTIKLIHNRTTLHMHHTCSKFLYNDMKWLNFKFTWEWKWVGRQ